MAQFYTSSMFAKQLENELEHLWRFAFRLSQSSEIAEELVQSTALRALEKQHQLSGNQKLRSWLFSVMHSIWKNELRQKAVRKNMAIHLPTNVTVTEDSAETQHFFTQIVNLVQQLPEVQREVILLVSVEGYSYQETSTILNIPLGTVMSRLSRARQSIGERMLSNKAPSSGDVTTPIKKKY